MISDRKMTVGTWSESQKTVVIDKREPKRFWSPAVVGLVGTLILHSLVLQTLGLGSRARAIRAPDVPKSGSSFSKSETEPAESLVLIELPKTASADKETEAVLIPLRGLLKDRPTAVSVFESPLPKVEILPLSDDKESESSVENSDGSERARLSGIYSGQIRARVERLWRRPRTPVNERNDPARIANSVDYFQCQVQIVQDSGGFVQEVLLPNCNGSVAWQRSLVIAIQQASPLPAPPSPIVFSRTLTEEFAGYSYTAGASEDEYEVPSIAPMQAAVSISH